VYYPVYRRIRKALLEHFVPQEKVDVLLVDILATDYVKLARACEMLEAAIAPVGSAEQLKDAKKHR
jgi:hypothetical protein